MKAKRPLWIATVLFISISVLTLRRDAPGSGWSVRWHGAQYWSSKKFGKAEVADYSQGRMANRRTGYIIGPISVLRRED